MNITKIEWVVALAEKLGKTPMSWNPLRGCRATSPLPKGADPKICHAYPNPWAWAITFEPHNENVDDILRGLER